MTKGATHARPPERKQKRQRKAVKDSLEDGGQNKRVTTHSHHGLDCTEVKGEHRKPSENTVQTAGNRTTKQEGKKNGQHHVDGSQDTKTTKTQNTCDGGKLIVYHEIKESAEERWMMLLNHETATQDHSTERIEGYIQATTLLDGKTIPMSKEEMMLANSYATHISKEGMPGEHTTGIWNVNGIRSLMKKGHLRRALLKHSPNVWAFSEIKISLKKLKRLRKLHLLLYTFGYKHCYWHPMTDGHGGLHGVAVFCKQEPIEVVCGWSHCTNENDGEGRVITTLFTSHIMVHTYTPCSSWPERKMSTSARKAKDDKRKHFDIMVTKHCAHVMEKWQKPLMYCGDLNVTATTADVNIRKQHLDEYPGHKHWERLAFHERNRNLGLTDAWRHFHPKPSEEDQTHWENDRAWSRECGQRIDYVLISQELVHPTLNTSESNETKTPFVSGITSDPWTFGSDHCPMFVKIRGIQTTTTVGETEKDIQTATTVGVTEVSKQTATTVGETEANEQTATTVGETSVDRTGNAQRETMANTGELPNVTAESLHEELAAMPSITSTLPPTGEELSEFDMTDYPPCLSSAHDYAFDRFVENEDPLFTAADNADVTADSATTVAQLMQCRAITASVPVSWIQTDTGGSMKVRALWDTGASYTILSHKAFMKHMNKGAVSECKQQHGVSPTFMLANGDLVKPAGRAQMTMHFGSEVIQHDAWIMRGGDFDLILGVDFFSKYDAAFHFTEGNQRITLHSLPTKPTVRFDIRESTTYRGAASPLVTQEAILLRPRTRYRTTLGLLPGDAMAGLRTSPCTGIVEGEGMGGDKQHNVVPSLSTLHDGFTVAELVNFSDKTVTLHKGTLVGSFSIVRQDVIPPSSAATTAAQTTNNVEGKHEHLNTVNLDEIGTTPDCPLNDEGLPVHLEPKLEKAKTTLNEAQYQKLKKLLIQFSDVFAKDYSKPPIATMEPMRINIPADTTPVSVPRRRFAPKERALIQKYAIKLLKSGVLEESDSPWRSNVLLVPKPDGSWRVCLDFREINKLTETTSSNLPSLADNLDLLGGKEIYSAFDILSAYWSCGLYKPHRKYTGFFVPGLGNLQFQRAAMGLSNSGTHFVKLTLKMLEGILFDYVAAYADDVFVYSDSIDQHIDEHLPEVLSRFRNYNVSLKGSKAELCVKELNWCGYHITTDGISADHGKVTAILDMKQPRTLRQLRSFLGSCNFLRRWLKDFAEMTDPLRVLLKKGHFKKKWSEPQASAWRALRSALASAPVLAHPRFDRPFFLHCDASTVAIGAALMQKDNDGETVVVSYLSKSLTKTQKNYAIHEIEALSVLYALETWHSYLFGQSPIDVHCDSQAVCWLFKPNSKYQGRCMRWALRAGRWDVKLHHIEGAKNHLADTLSRCPGEGKSQTPKHEPEVLCSACTTQEPNALHAMTRAKAKSRVEKHAMDTTPSTTEKTTRTDKEEMDTIDDAKMEDKSHNPWRSILPECEFDDDILALRPDLKLWHRIKDKASLFRQHQQEDEAILKRITTVLETKCKEACSGCTHAKECMKRWWGFTAEGLLVKKSTTKPLPRRSRAVDIFFRLQSPCTCDETPTQCVHQQWCTSTRDIPTTGIAKSDCCTVSALLHLPHPRGPLGVDFDQFNVHGRTTKLVVPQSLVTSVLYHIHGSGVAGHPGATRSLERASKRFWWKGMRKNVRRWVGSCLRCRQRKPPRPQNVNKPGRTTLPAGPMQEIYIDFSGPFPETTRGNKWILTIVCAYARYPIAVAMPRRTASLVVRALMEHVIQHYSCPCVMVSDGAREFVGQTVKDFCTVFNIEHKVNPAYSPSLASYVERYHAWQNACLTIVTSRHKNTWDLMLPLVSLSYTTTVHASIGCTPFEAIRGYEPRMPFDSWSSWSTTDRDCKEVSMIERNMREIYDTIKKSHDKASTRNKDNRAAAHRPTTYMPGDVVLRFAPKTTEVVPKTVAVKPKLMDRWSLPNIVVARGDKGMLIVRDENGKLHDVRADLVRRFDFYHDGLPSIHSRRRFSKEERALLNKNLKATTAMRKAKMGDMVCFPLTVSSGAGFGIGQILRLMPDGSYDAQFYSNDAESLTGSFRPCWLNNQNQWYCGPRRQADHRPMSTTDFYSGKLRTECFAAVGFRLLETLHVPSAVLRAMHDHKAFEWTMPGNQ